MKWMFASLLSLMLWSSISHSSLWPEWHYTLSPSEWKLQWRRQIFFLLLIQSLLRGKWPISSSFSYFISLFWGFLLLKGPMARLHLLLGALKAHIALKQLNSDNKTRASSAASPHCGLVSLLLTQRQSPVETYLYLFALHTGIAISRVWQWLVILKIKYKSNGIQTTPNLVNWKAVFFKHSFISEVLQEMHSQEFGCFNSRCNAIRSQEH